MTTLAALNDRFGLGVDLVFVVAIWVGIAAVAVSPALAEAVVTVAGLGAGLVGAAQVAVIRNEGVTA